MNTKDTSKTVRHALQLLRCFTHNRPTLATPDLVRELKLSRTNVLRLLATLEESGFIEKTTAPTRYRIGIRAFEIGSLYLITNPASLVMTKALGELVEKTRCTAYLGILDGNEAVCLTYREGVQPIRFVWKVGNRLPCATTSLGKAILMHLPDDEVERRLGPSEVLDGVTDHSIRSRSRLLAELAVFRKQGWASTEEESHAGVSAVGSAVLDSKGYPIAGVSVSFFDYPPDPSRKVRYAEVVKDVATKVSKQIAQYEVYGNAQIR